VINGCDEVFRGAEPERTGLIDLILLFTFLDGSVGELDPGPWQNPVQMRLQQAHESLDKDRAGIGWLLSSTSANGLPLA